MSSIIPRDKQQYLYEDEESSILYIPIPNNTTIESLEVLVYNLKFIYFWIKLFHHNYEVI